VLSFRPWCVKKLPGKEEDGWEKHKEKKGGGFCSVGAYLAAIFSLLWGDVNGIPGAALLIVAVYDTALPIELE
jgi:hypothetical protein